VDLSQVDALAISHHHYDHGGGLKRFFQENQGGKVYLRQSSTSNFIGKMALLPAKYIGLDQAVLVANADRITYVHQAQEILPGVHLLTELPESYPKPAGDSRLKMRIGQQTVPDTFAHELVTVLEGDDGLVILTGCAHNGVLNMIEATKIALPGQPIRAVIGGFHLKRETDQTVRQICEALLAMDIPAIYTGHCTGETAYGVLESVLGDRLHPLYTGLVMVF
jgi:7,8-dihydropterin-6-yl-methyl-4-(beta-D-ribofuranosyl)aminobenzene 5'-phosphate synthase